MSAVRRLTRTLELVKGSTLDQLKKYVRLMDPDKAYKAYRDTLVCTQLPMIPYLGVQLSDLTFAETAMPDRVPCPDAHGGIVINFRKVQLVIHVINLTVSPALSVL
jgi:hypothetical protein